MASSRPHSRHDSFENTTRELATRLIVSVLATFGSITLLLNVDDLPAFSHALFWCLLVVAVPTGVVSAGILVTRTYEQRRQRRTATTARTQ